MKLAKKEKDKTDELENQGSKTAFLEVRATDTV